MDEYKRKISSGSKHYNSTLSLDQGYKSKKPTYVVIRVVSPVLRPFLFVCLSKSLQQYDLLFGWVSDAYSVR